LSELNLPSELKRELIQWKETYHALYHLLGSDSEYSDWAKSKLLDEMGFVNLEGLRLSQQISVIRKNYYWIYQNVGDKGYKFVDNCPFCGLILEPFENIDVRVCPDCMVAYPDDLKK
jgi:predicted  nucleic acid-binding Zn ribbon protein